MAYQPETGLQKFMRSKAAPYVGMLLATLIGLLFAYAGLYTILCGFGGALLIGVLLYVVPKSMGASTKQLAVFGIVFFVVATMFSAFVVSKPMIESFDGENGEGDFQNVSVSPFGISDNGIYTITVEYRGTTAGNVTLYYGKVNSVWTTVWTESKIDDGVLATTVNGNVYTFEVSLDSGNIYDYRFSVGSQKSAYFIGPAAMSDSDLTMFCIQWNIYGIVVNIMVLFFLILALTTWMRKSLEKTRERLEREGRLYPQGYGRCKECGTIVLPGEVVCRKCGAYVDVPEDLKPKKVEFFECSECGKEVPSSADVCPVCGAKFDGTEDESEEPKEIASGQTFTCSECKNEVPADADVCPHCGEKFEE